MANTWTVARFLNESIPGLLGVAVDSYDSSRKESALEKLCTVKPSKKSKEEVSFRSSLGFLQIKPEGDGVGYDVQIQGPKQTWVPRVRALGVRITKEAVSDNLYELNGGGSDNFSEIMKDLGDSAAQTPDVLLGQAFDNAAVTTYHAAADGLAWASATHLRYDGSTYSNYATQASPTHGAVWAAIEAAENQYDHRQKRVICTVEAVVYPIQGEKYFEEIFRSPDRWDTANRATNVLKETRGGIKRINFRHWSDADAWALKLKGFRYGLIWFENWKTAFAKEGDFETGDMRLKVTRRDSMEMGDPREYYWNIPA